MLLLCGRLIVQLSIADEQVLLEVHDIPNSWPHSPFLEHAAMTSDSSSPNVFRVPDALIVGARNGPRPRLEAIMLLSDAMSRNGADCPTAHRLRLANDVGFAPGRGAENLEVIRNPVSSKMNSAPATQKDQQLADGGG